MGLINVPVAFVGDQEVEVRGHDQDLVKVVYEKDGVLQISWEPIENVSITNVVGVI